MGSKMGSAIRDLIHKSSAELVREIEEKEGKISYLLADIKEAL